MRTLSLTSAAALILLLSACSGGDAPQAAPAAAASEGGTSLSIDAKDGAVSYESDDGKNSTSISVGGDGDDKKDKKPE